MMEMEAWTNRHRFATWLLATAAIFHWMGLASSPRHAIAAFTADSASFDVKARPPGPSRISSIVEKYTYRETVKTVIDENHLPELPELLQDIGLGERVAEFYRKNVFETKYLFTMNNMDLRLVGLSPAEVERVKDKVTELRVEKHVTEERIHPLLEERNALSYGRLLINNSVSSFEFYLASFGPPTPVDEATLVWAEPRDACRPIAPPPAGVDRSDGSSDMSRVFVLAIRGKCSFVDKANNVAESNASALVLVNTGDEAEDLFRVSATLGGRSGGKEDPKSPERTATVMVRGSALSSISKALEWGAVVARLVPLDCKPGRAACEALLPEERSADLQVDSGSISLLYSTIDEGVTLTRARDSFDFLSATFGATLPGGQVPLIQSVPDDACMSLRNPSVTMTNTNIYFGSAVLVRRGGCSFGQKAKNIQDAGGRVMVVADNGLGALQNVGAPDPLAKELYIPGVFVTARAGDVLAAAAATDLALGTTARSVIAGYDGIFRSRQLEENRFSRAVVSFFPNNGVGRAWAELGATRWPGELLETRVLAKQLQAAHVESPCRSWWIQEKVQELQGTDVDGFPQVMASVTQSRGIRKDDDTRDTREL